MQPHEIEIDVLINDPGWPQLLDGVQIAHMIRNAIFVAAKIAEIHQIGPLEISVLLSNDEDQKTLNKQWRGRDSSTNVLSFPQIEPPSPLIGMLGDIVLALETVENEAKNNQITFSDHLSHLIVHGFIHLLGYDHQNDKDAVEMENLETKILAALEIADPYAE